MVAGARPLRRDPADRLDPVRGRRPGRVTLLRCATVAVLVVVAAALTWFSPSSCAPALPGPDVFRSVSAPGQVKRAVSDPGGGFVVLLRPG
jgi:hypothetical protein